MGIINIGFIDDNFDEYCSGLIHKYTCKFNTFSALDETSGRSGQYLFSHIPGA
uniref:Uncharacterized protein n=1 Tax=Lepeophtheirus salmonis TaxID=72036 RepID=A0A0K2UDP7_LEPSM